MPLPGSAAARDQYMAGAFARFMATRPLSARPAPGPIIAKRYGIRTVYGQPVS